MQLGASDHPLNLTRRGFGPASGMSVRLRVWISLVAGVEGVLGDTAGDHKSESIHVVRPCTRAWESRREAN